MAFPVLILPPHAPQAFGPPTGDVWTIKSAAQNRTLTRQVTYNPATCTEMGRSGFADQHLIDQVVNIGVAWHEGQLFGVANQIIGVLTAVALIGLSVVGVLMWLRRRPANGFGPPPAGNVTLGRVAFALVALGILLPLFGASVLVILIVDRIGR